ncbi:MAG: hypothetical protein ACK559_16765, partial [bacterium]
MLPFHITKPGEISMDEIEITTLKDEVNTEIEKTSKSAINQGYLNKISQSSRRSWREEECSHTSYMKKIIPMFEGSMKSYFKSKELDYDVTVGSILHDEGVQPHIQ